MNKLDTRTRQIQIREASLNLIKEGGIQHLTMKRISEKIGISEQAIYRHYKNKQDILCSIIHSFNEHFESVFDSVRKIPTAKGRMHVFIDEHFRYFQANPATAAAIFSEEIFQYDSELAHKVNGLVERRIEIITQYIVQAQRSGELRQDVVAEDMAIILLGSIRFLVTAWRLQGFSYDLREKGKSLKSTLTILID